MKKNSNINSLFDSAYVWFVWNVTAVFVERNKQIDDATWRSKNHSFSILWNINWLNYINDAEIIVSARPHSPDYYTRKHTDFPGWKKRRHSADSLSSCASYYMHYTMHSDVELEKCETEIILRFKPAREPPQNSPTYQICRDGGEILVSSWCWRIIMSWLTEHDQYGLSERHITHDFERHVRTCCFGLRELSKKAKMLLIKTCA